MEQPSTTQDAVAVWKIAHQFVLDVYKLTQHWPHEEYQGLIPKVRNSAVKTASNIVEGHSRQSAGDYGTHLADAQAALEETKYSLLVARDLGYLAEIAYERLMNDAEDIADRLEGLRRGLGSQPSAALPKVSQSQARQQLFGVAKGVRDTTGDFFAWLRGGKAKVAARRHEQAMPNIWAEDGNTPAYLEEPDQQ